MDAKQKKKPNYFFYINATILVITIGASLLLWFGFITRTWPHYGWDDRIIFLFFPSHGIAMIAYGALKMWRLKKDARRNKNEPVVQQAQTSTQQFVKQEPSVEARRKTVEAEL